MLACTPCPLMTTCFAEPGRTFPDMRTQMRAVTVEFTLVVRNCAHQHINELLITERDRSGWCCITRTTTSLPTPRPGGVAHNPARPSLLRPPRSNSVSRTYTRESAHVRAGQPALYRWLEEAALRFYRNRFRSSPYGLATRCVLVGENSF